MAFLIISLILLLISVWEKKEGIICPRNIHCFGQAVSEACVWWFAAEVSHISAAVHGGFPQQIQMSLIHCVAVCSSRFGSLVCVLLRWAGN